MHLILPPLPLFVGFLLASLILAITPGPGVLYIVTRSASQGRRSGLTSVAGVALGNLSNAIGASLGLAALFAVSSVAFTIVKYCGAVYLIYLGIKTLRSSRRAALPDETSYPTSSFHVFRDGFAVALFNPKTTLFFAAFLPQFLPSPRATITQTVALGVVFVMIAATTDSIYAMAAGIVKSWFSKRRRARNWGQILAGSVYIFLGLFTACTGQRVKN